MQVIINWVIDKIDDYITENNKTIQRLVNWIKIKLMVRNLAGLKKIVVLDKIDDYSIGL